MNSSSSIRNWAFFTSAVLLGALCLLWTAIENGYPLMYSDTGTYIGRSFTLELTGSRTIFYSLFIRATRIVDSLWVVVTIQALWTSWLLVRNTVCLFPRGYGRSFIALGIVVATVVCTGVARYVGWVMPDLFTSWLFLGGLLFYLSSHWMDRVMASISIGLAILVHNSHFALSGFVLALLYAVGILSRSRLSPSFWKILRDLTLLYVLVVAISSLVNFSKGGTFVPVRGGPTFVINRFIHSGVLIKTLDRYCGEKKWKFCNHKELFRSKTGTRSWFLWRADSPISELGGWAQAGGEQSEVIGHAFRCCSWFILTTMVDDFVRQLVMINSEGSLRSYDERNSVYRQIRDRYPNDLERVSSLQSTDKLAMKKSERTHHANKCNRYCHLICPM